MAGDLTLEFESKGANYRVKTEVYPHNSGFTGKWVELRWELYQGAHIGNGMLASDESLGGWVCRMAEIRPHYKGRGLYRSVLRLLRKHYGPIISDDEMSDDAVRAWEHIPEAVYDKKLDRWRLNPRVNLKKAAKVPARLLARGTRVEMEHTRSKRAARIIASHHIAEDPRYYAKLAVMERNPPRVLSYAEAHRWEPLAKARGVSAVARSERGFMRMYQRAGTWDNVNDYWRKRRAAFIARHMAQGRHEALWKKDRSGKLQPSRRCLALIMWGYKP